jgi:hypothetical protein
LENVRVLELGYELDEMMVTKLVNVLVSVIRFDSDLESVW